MSTGRYCSSCLENKIQAYFNNFSNTTLWRNFGSSFRWYVFPFKVRSLLIPSQPNWVTIEWHCMGTGEKVLMQALLCNEHLAWTYNFRGGKSIILWGRHIKYLEWAQIYREPNNHCSSSIQTQHPFMWTCYITTGKIYTCQQSIPTKWIMWFKSEKDLPFKIKVWRNSK